MKIWKLNAHHQFPDETIQMSSERGSVPIGWAYSGDLNELKPRSIEDIEEAIYRNVPDRENAQTGAQNLWKFLLDMKKEDIVLLCSGLTCAVFQICGEYTYAGEDRDIFNYRHQRSASLLHKEIDQILKEYSIDMDVFNSTVEVLTLLADVDTNNLAQELI